VTDAPVTLTVGEADPDLDTQLNDGLTAFNVHATGDADQRQLTVRVAGGDGRLVAGLSGWTWGTCCGISLVWVREDARASGWGAQLLAAAETEARSRGCEQVVVSSFSFQAPGFYERHGYVETGRTEGIPRTGSADVHLRKIIEAS
jgi:GNAT superfamily N-acetyltransferase